MRKNFVRAAVATAAISSAISFSAFAEETIKEVKFEAYIDLDAPVSTGISSPDFYSLNEDAYSLDWEETGTSTSAKNEKTYKLTFSAGSGYTFPSSASSVTVSGTGVQSITSKSVKDSGETLEVKVKAYPYSQLDAPEITESDLAADAVAFDKKGAGKMEYYIIYTDYEGEEREKHGTTTASSVKISSYNKKYTGSNSEKKDMQVTGFWVRALQYSSAKNPNIVPSAWTGVGAEPEDELGEYECWGDYFEERAASGTGSTSAGTVQPTQPVQPAQPSQGWVGSGDDWQWKNADGTYGTGWIWDGSNYYYCDAAAGGKMKAGWLFDTDGNWYYLNTQHDGTYGRMLTGWQDINGKRYYLRPNAGGPMGSMIANSRVSINGQIYTFDAGGALIQ